MKLIMARYKVKADQVKENEMALAKVFAAISEAKPSGIRYASFKLEDGVTFVALVQIDEEMNKDRNPLLELPAFKEFQAGVPDRCEQMPVTETLHAVGTYRFFDEL